MVRTMFRRVWRRIRQVFSRTPSPPKRCAAFKVSEDNVVFKLKYSRDEPMVSLLARMKEMTEEVATDVYGVGVNPMRFDLCKYRRMMELTREVVANAVDANDEEKA